MTDKIIKNYTIPESSSQERLDQALAKLMPEYSRTQIKAWLDEGAILVDGKPCKGKVKVRGNEQITVNAVAKAQPAWGAEAIPLNIVYEDESLLIVHKPKGLVVHPGAGNQQSTMLNALLHHAPSLQSLPRAGILHRLDKNTSGLLIIAKTAAALKDLSYQLKKRTIEREYQAIVNGQIISGGTIEAPIDRHPMQRKRMAVVEDGKHAVTHYRVMERYRSFTRLRVKLETGRTHQIRVHMAHIRHPIIGDDIYGTRLQLAKHMSDELIALLRGYRTQALHAFAIGFTHPETGEFMRFEIDIPDEMKTLMAALREDLEKNRE